MKFKVVMMVLAFCSLAQASQLDSKSLFIGIGIGSGVYATRNVVVKPVAKATAKAAKKTARATVHAVTLGRK